MGSLSTFISTFTACYPWLYLISFAYILYSCWMFVRGSEAWYFGAPVLILVVVRKRTL